MENLTTFFWQKVNYSFIKKIIQKIKSPVLLFYILSLSFYIIYVFYIHSPWQDIHIEGYIDRASSLAKGSYPGKWDTFYPVGMTYILAPFFYILNYDLALRIIAIFYAVLLATANYLVFRIVLDFYKSKTGAWLAMVFCAAYYPFIAYIGFYLSEIPFVFLLVLSMYLLCRAFNQKKSRLSTALLAGLIMGFAAIVRSTLFPAWILFLILLIIKRPLIGYKRILLFSLGFLFVVAIQTVRNSFIMERFTLFSTNGGANAYLGQAHIKKVSGTPAYGGWYWYDTNCVWDKTLTKEEIFNFDGWDESKLYSKVVDLWKENPKKQILLSLQNGVDMFYLVDKHWFIFNSSASNSLNHKFQWSFVVLVYIPLVLTFVWMIKDRKSRFLNLIFMIPIISVILMAMITKGEERYLMPFQYLMVILVAPFWGSLLLRLITKITEKNRYRLI